MAARAAPTCAVLGSPPASGRRLRWAHLPTSGDPPPGPTRAGSASEAGPAGPRVGSRCKPSRPGDCEVRRLQGLAPGPAPPPSPGSSPAHGPAVRILEHSGAWRVSGRGQGVWSRLRLLGLTTSLPVPQTQAQRLPLPAPHASAVCRSHRCYNHPVVIPENRNQEEGWPAPPCREAPDWLLTPSGLPPPDTQVHLYSRSFHGEGERARGGGEERILNPSPNPIN